MTAEVLVHILATLAAIIALGYVFGHICRRLGQPPVIGEMIAGILLGPSLLGAISPEAMHLLIPSPAHDPHRQVATALRVLSQLGVVLYMFLVGLDLDGARLKDQARSAFAISLTGIAVPFALGVGLALWLHPILSRDAVPFASFSLFLGVAMAITAFPVLARILADSGLERTPLGILALGSAAADDVAAWTLLALAVGVAQAQVGGAVLTGALAGLFILAMLVVVRPLLAKLMSHLDAQPGSPPFAVPGLFLLILLSSLATEWIGIHAVFGAFVLGAILPHSSRIAKDFAAKIHAPVTVLLLPAFFATTGMRMRIGLLDTGEDWLIAGAIALVATLGKFGGCAVAARLTGQTWRDSAGLGALMNSRGLMGLIVLDIGLDMGVISERLFAMLVLMALATTLAASPMLKLLGITGENSHAV